MDRLVRDKIIFYVERLQSEKKKAPEASRVELIREEIEKDGRIIYCMTNTNNHNKLSH